MANTPQTCNKFKRPWQNRLYARYLPLRKRWGDALSALWRFLRGGLTLMFIPHSERGIYKLRIYNWFILSLLLLLSGAVVFSIVIMNAEEARVSRITHIRTSAQQMLQELRAFRQRARVAYTLYSGLRDEMTRLRTVFGATGSPYRPVSIGGGIDASNPAPSLETAGLAEMGTNFRAMATEVSGVVRMFAEVRRRMREIPSIWPLMGRDGVVTSPFGERASPFTGLPVKHTGIDIASYWGSPIRVTADGVVEQVGIMGGYGLCVIVRHRYGITTRYAHLSSARVRAGQDVKQGQFIARMGNSGLAIGWHLHYEVLFEEKGYPVPVDPAPFLQSWF